MDDETPRRSVPESVLPGGLSMRLEEASTARWGEAVPRPVPNSWPLAVQRLLLVAWLVLTDAVSLSASGG